MGSCAPVGGNGEVVVISLRKAVAENKTQGYGPYAEQTLDSESYQVHNMWKSDREWTRKHKSFCVAEFIKVTEDRESF